MDMCLLIGSSDTLAIRQTSSHCQEYTCTLAHCFSKRRGSRTCLMYCRGQGMQEINTTLLSL